MATAKSETTNRGVRAYSTWALLLVILGGLGGPGWFWWKATRRGEINFLPHRAGAEWVLYPIAPDLPPRSRLELSTVFKRSFTLDQVPASAALAVAGFHRYVLEINGRAAGARTRAGRNWKDPDEFDLVGFLRTGENQVSVTVFNTNGPPALWCLLVAGSFRLGSDESWQASYAGATWRAARLAASTKLVPKGSPGFGPELPWPGLLARWPTLLIFTVLSAAVYWLLKRRSAQSSKLDVQSSRFKVQGSKFDVVSRWREHLPLLVLAAAWIALFANNAGVLPPRVGFDFEAHRAYIRYILDHHALPLASQGWEMYQPPLYYIVCALLLKLLGFSTTDPGGLMALRFLGFGIGLAHLVALWGTLRLLFPGQRSQQWAGLAVAAALPPLLYLNQYLSNEAPAAALYTACLYLTLRILGHDRPSWRLCVGLGMCLGAALLAKASAVLLLPPIFGALVWKALCSAECGVRSAEPDQSRSTAAREPELNRRDAKERREEKPLIGEPLRSSRLCGFRALSPFFVGSLLRVAAILAVCLAICGWHYARMWSRFGNPLIGSWDPKVGFAWWAHNGYQTATHYLRFGTALSSPWFSGLNSFSDGLYSTLWGDSLLGGMAVLIARPPWNYDLMAAGYLLALLPTFAAILGGFVALIKFVRKPAPEGFMLLGLFYLTLFALVSMSLNMPACAIFKAFYGLPALVPFCAFAARGLDRLWRWSGKLRPMLTVGFCIWALNSYASFWIARSSGPAQVARPWSLFRENRDAEALRLLDNRLERDPHDGDARWVRTMILLKQNNYRQAVREGEIMVRDEPASAPGHLALAMALRDGQQAEQAIAQARAAVEAAPGYGAAYDCLAALLLQEAHYEECERVARRGLGVLPYSAELRLALGASLSGGANDAEAEAQLQLAFTLNRNWPEGYLRLARALAGRGRLDEAANCLGQAARLAPKDGQIFYEAATILAQQGRAEEAGGAAKRARELALAAGQRDLAHKSEQLLEALAARKAGPP